jgi:LemA protein
MRMNNKAPIVILVIAVVLGLWMLMLNNQLVALQESCRSSWAQVETVLQRRFDLIPNLVNTVKGYAAHEKGLIEEVTRLRTQWAQANTPDEKTMTAGKLEGAIGRLLMVAEQYPDLKASGNFRDLQAQLEGTENRIAVERQRYNDALRAYNTAVRQFPASIIAGMRGFQPNTAYFESAPVAKDPPKVDFSERAR